MTARRNGAAIAGLFLVLGCRSTSTVREEKLEGVSVSFDHLGRAVDPLDQHMAESGALPAARQSGSDYWLRLTNTSDQVIAFRTYSTYMKPPIKWFELPDGRRVIALEDGMEISLPFGVESRKGSPVDFGAGGDMFWQSFLPPGRSVLFSVPASALKHHRRVFVEFEQASKQTGRSYRAYFQPASSP